MAPRLVLHPTMSKSDHGARTSAAVSGIKMVPKDGIDPSYSGYRPDILPLNYSGIVLVLRGRIELPFSDYQSLVLPLNYPRNLNFYLSITVPLSSTNYWGSHIAIYRPLSGAIRLR